MLPPTLFIRRHWGSTTRVKNQSLYLRYFSPELILEVSMGIKTYIYRTEYANYQTRLVTSNGGHPIPYNSEIVVEFPNDMKDAAIEFSLEQLNKGTPDSLNLGLRRYVFVCGERIPVESYQSYRQSPSQGDAFSLKVQQWLDGQISQMGEDIVPIISSTISSTTSLTSYLDKDEHDNTTGTFKLRNTQAEESNSFPLVYLTTNTSSSSSKPTAIDERLSSLIRSSQLQFLVHYCPSLFLMVLIHYRRAI